MKLKDRVAMVTGGSRGIGRAICLALATEGADVALNYHTAEAHAKETVRALERMGRRAASFAADVSDLVAVTRLKAQILDTFGHVDILVNCAGITRDRTFLKMDPALWHEVISTNLDGVFHCTKAFLPQMVQRGYGRVVNITSVVAQRGSFGQTNYAASKAAIIGFTRNLAIEMAAKGVTVNAVAPGYIETEMLAAVPEAVRAQLLSRIPLGRFGTPEEVARAVLFLVSEGDYITGDVLNVNGGLV